VGSLGNTGLAGRARGDLDTVLVQKVQQDISLTSRHRDVEISGQASIERAPDHNLWHSSAQLGSQRIPQGAQSLRMLQA
jgi:hypothetical protein